MAETPEPPRISPWQLNRESWWWIVIACLMIAAGWIKTINLLLLFGYVMLGLLAINARVARRIARRVEASRVPLPAGFAGQRIVRSIDVSNISQRPIDISLSERSSVHVASFFVPSLAPGETRRVFAEFTCPTRGCYQVSPLFAEAGYPFGLIRYVKPMAGEDELVLLPAVGTIDTSGLRRWLIRTGAGDANSRKLVLRHSSHHADVRGVRTYRPGDSQRDIHWRTSARRNTLMVREYDSTEPLDLILIVEPWLPSGATDAEHERLESALSLATTLCWSWCHAEEASDVTLILSGPNGDWKSGRGLETFARHSLSILANAQGTPQTLAIPADAIRKRSNRCARLLVTSNPKSPLERELRNRFGLPFVVITPMESIAWYTPPQRPSAPND